ncbi:MAG: glycosyltransferase family 1 protein [Firmicutes bacterium]|nr:glycosyltransferase family 1 protein [Bacillota bacterium]
MRRVEVMQCNGGRAPRPETRWPSVVYPPTIDWSYLYQRPQQLMTALARLGYRVFFCNPTPVGQRRGSRKLGPNLYLVHGFPPPAILGPAPIVWVSYPPHVRSLALYRPGVVVFDAVDAPVEEFAAWAADIEALRAGADVVFASSRALYASHLGRHPEVHLCPNGADYAHFARAAAPGPLPVELLGLPRPLVGYIGALAGWIDWELLRTVAAANPDFSFVFVGPPFGGAEELPSGPNLHFLGHRDYRLLPDYLRAFDACLIPFRLSPLTAACNPIKLWEYLAAGKPVVATALPEVEEYGTCPGIWVARGTKEFGLYLRQAVTDRNPAGVLARQALARENSWDVRAAQIHRVLQRILAQKRVTR